MHLIARELVLILYHSKIIKVSKPSVGRLRYINIAKHFKNVHMHIQRLAI